jgi:hypothetical protein
MRHANFSASSVKLSVRNERCHVGFNTCDARLASRRSCGAYCELQGERSTETRFPFEAGIGPELSFDRGTDIRFLIRTAYADTPAMFICSNFPHYVVFF